MKNTVNAILRIDLTSDNLEAVSVEIWKPNSKPFIISACYRAPRADDVFFDAINQLIAIVDAEDKELILLGDLNCNQISERLWL